MKPDEKYMQRPYITKDASPTYRCPVCKFFYDNKHEMTRCKKLPISYFGDKTRIGDVVMANGSIGVVYDMYVMPSSHIHISKIFHMIEKSKTTSTACKIFNFDDARTPSLFNLLMRGKHEIK